MELREATKEDIPQIVELLKRALGEGLIKKSEKSWTWKHLHNPYGPSPVLVATDGDEIVGLRAMMQWQFNSGNKVYKAVRAVDTATDPSHQGKGIFKKLTLSMIDWCKDEGYDFVFNTPNEKSMPGYLKMGWKELYKIPVRFKLNPFYWLSPKHPVEHFKPDESSWPALEAERQAYYKWRYVDNPLASYHQIRYGSRGIAFFRIKKNRLFTELRICDLYPDHEATNELRGQLNQAMKCFSCLVASVGFHMGKEKKLFDNLLFLPPMKLGNTLTGRELVTNPDQYFLPMKSVNFDLGTFELF